MKQKRSSCGLCGSRNRQSCFSLCGSRNRRSCFSLCGSRNRSLYWHLRQFVRWQRLIWAPRLKPVFKEERNAR